MSERPSGDEDGAVLAGSTPASVTVYGPYERLYKRTGQTRRQVVLITPNGTTSMSYARWLMCQKLDRWLTPEEHVDHIDEDCMNDNLDNLQILTRQENNAKTLALKGHLRSTKGIERGWQHGTMYGWQKKKCDCPECTKVKRESYDERNAKRRRGDGRGPYKPRTPTPTELR